MQSGMGAIADIGRITIELCWTIAVIAAVALVFVMRYLLRYLFTSPAHASAWARVLWANWGKPAPVGRGGWWGHWWRNRATLPDRGVVLLLPAPAARPGHGPGPGRGRGRRRGR